MNRKFTITGQCDPNRHYMVNITTRLQKIEMLIEEGAYFCINRGRQYHYVIHMAAMFGFVKNERACHGCKSHI